MVGDCPSSFYFFSPILAQPLEMGKVALRPPVVVSWVLDVLPPVDRPSVFGRVVESYALHPFCGDEEEEEEGDSSSLELEDFSSLVDCDDLKGVGAAVFRGSVLEKMEAGVKDTSHRFLPSVVHPRPARSQSHHEDLEMVKKEQNSSLTLSTPRVGVEEVAMKFLSGSYR